MRLGPTVDQYERGIGARCQVDNRTLIHTRNVDCVCAARVDDRLDLGTIGIRVGRISRVSVRDGSVPILNSRDVVDHRGDRYTRDSVDQL